MAVLNDFKHEFKIHMAETDKTYRSLGAEIGSTGQSLNRLVSTSIEERTPTIIVNRLFVKACEAMGYDIRIQYIKRKESNADK